MGRKLQTIYEYFSDYTEEQINSVVYGLSVDEILVIKSRYGNDLHNPSLQSDWEKENSNKYYGSIIPKMKRRLAKLLEQEKEMDDYQSQLLQLIKEGKNNREICEILNISFNQLNDELLELKTQGIKYFRKYYSDGSIKYNKISSLKKLNENIIATAKEQGKKLHIGTMLTCDAFGPYINMDNVLKRIPEDVKPIAEEMEAYALVHVANSFKKEATAIVTAVDSKFSDVVLPIEDREKSLDDMITLALDAIIK